MRARRAAAARQLPMRWPSPWRLTSRQRIADEPAACADGEERTAASSSAAHSTKPACARLERRAACASDAARAASDCVNDHTLLHAAPAMPRALAAAFAEAAAAPMRARCAAERLSGRRNGLARDGAATDGIGGCSVGSSTGCWSGVGSCG